jgi:hypothetical protein
MKNALDRINQLPNSNSILSLYNKAKEEMDDSSLEIRDINEHPERNLLTSYGRYERDTRTIWMKTDLPDDVTEYIIAHEIGHVMQDANGFPQVSIRDVLRDCKIHNGDKELVYPDIIVRIHQLTNAISNLLLDSGADSFARINNLLSRDALSYMKHRDQKNIQCLDFPKFDRKKLAEGIDNTLNSIKKGTAPSSPQIMRLLLETARRAMVYAVYSLRYSQMGLFDSLDKKYGRKQLVIHKLGNELLDVLKPYELNTVVGCQKAAMRLINYLHLPSEAVGLRACQEWIA